MTRSRATQGSAAQFTYDFGIAIAQSTVSKIVRLTGASLTLASAFYALRSTADQYVKTLKENSLQFGGVLSTMKVMEQAQNRLIKGQSYFSVEDQLKGMNDLMSVGINVGKNLDWINKAAHATGKSFSQFSGMIANAVNGNLQGLVNAGLMTQRATKMFAKFQGNTVMMQNAVMSFLRRHKGLMSAIKNDFITIQDGMIRLREVFKSFLESIIGKPNDPGSLYGTVAQILKEFGDKFGKDGVLTKNMIALRNYGKGVGIVMTWIVRQVGHVMMWLGRQAKKVVTMLLGTSDTFVERMRSLIVWLEFWKLKIVDFFKDYGSEIKTVLKLVLAYKALKLAFVIGSDALLSVITYRRNLANLFTLQGKYLRKMDKTGVFGTLTSWLTSLAVYMPKGMRKIWVAIFRGLESWRVGIIVYMSKITASIMNIFRGVKSGIAKVFMDMLEPLKWALKPMRDMFKSIWKGLEKPSALKSTVAIFKTIGRLLVSPVRLIGIFGSKLLSLGGIVQKVFGAFRMLFTLFNTSNPVGWIILGITLLITLYTKCESFRILINGMFKYIFETVKLVWNSAMYLFTWLMIGVKKLWSGIKWLWGKITGFFSGLWEGAKKLWAAFMNTRVGKWIKDNLIDPLMTAFDWIVRAWNTIVQGFGKLANLLGITNDAVSGATEDLAEKYGVPKLPVFGGNTYDINDDKNYLDNPFKGLFGGNDKEAANPIMDVAPVAASSGARGGSSTNMSFGSGAIQIVVQKGENIDENKLARTVKQVILDMKRDTDMRGGMA